MYIQFYGEVAKVDPATAALQQLRDFLDPREPQLASILVNTWRTQGRAITYKELREAIMYLYKGGGLDDVALFVQLMDDWRQDYTRFVSDVMAPRWEDAITASTSKFARRFPQWTYDGIREGVKTWTEQAGAIFVTNSTATQIAGIREMIKWAATTKEVNVVDLSKIIRPCVGLYKEQAAAASKYFDSMIKNGVSERLALDRTTRYAARLQRQRAMTIARTELAFAYNHGAEIGIQQAQRDGLMGETERVWSTADDERVCPVCGALEGKAIAMEDEFDFDTKLTYPGIRKTPPAHPRCRCGVWYREISPPKFKEATI